MTPTPAPGKLSMWRWTAIAAAPILVLVIVSYVWFDLSVAESLDSLQSAEKQTVEHVTWLGEAKIWLYITIPLAIACWAFRRRAWSIRFAFIAASIGVAGLGVNVLKIIFGRYRPGEWLENRNFGFEWFTIGYDQNSFPSGHAMVGGALAGALCILMPRLWRVWVVGAIIVASTRLFTGSHYLSDVIAGLALGALVSILMHRLFVSRKLL